MDDQQKKDFKRLIICCDGTWQASDRPSAEPGANVESNVTKFCRALSKSIERADGGGKVQQVVFYQSGIGTDALTKVSETIVGALGFGLAENVVEAYNFLSLNFEEGDEIFMFGFSRGAYTVRSLAGLVSDLGIVDKNYLSYFPNLYQAYQVGRKKGAEEYLKEHPIAIRQEDLKPRIKVMGCWDTVGSLGVPDTWITNFWPFRGWKEQNQFHNTDLCDNIENAFHALALDEHRRPFSPALWHLSKNSKTNLVQCWFPGYHINVGGGSKHSYQGDSEQLADITFSWMVDLCYPFLEFDSTFLHYLYRHHMHRTQPPGSWPNTPLWAAGKFVDPYAGVQMLGGSRTRTPGQYKPELLEGSDPKITKEYMHSSVRIRLKSLGSEGWGIKSTALKDFDLVEDVDAEKDVDAMKDDRRSGWKWVKKLPGGEKIEIPEMRVKRDHEGLAVERKLMGNDTLEKVDEGTIVAVKLVNID